MTQSTALTCNFSYGSNMWREQMERRCPESKFVGVGTLKNWRWFINERGVANLIRSEEDQNDVVYGFIYQINARDEANLDRYEGSPEIYQKVHGVTVELIVRSKVDVVGIGDTLDTLVYMDQNHVTDGKIRQEYIPRMHRVMEDGIREGIPTAYFDKYFKPFVPSQSS
ncbi:hypothetical protein F5050DRAFT_1573169 [Lentinula boryana]|uniref:gamma-glutamylcyclotransferase n=1 Tax=Lentinula boryana TaxID=40481 RepID=A0ABQ8QB23_9AGAR|nr:hypothetical protein F5050DRAFT_1573169 [Lentinula boryana]